MYYNIYKHKYIRMDVCADVTSGGDVINLSVGLAILYWLKGRNTLASEHVHTHTHTHFMSCH